VTTQTTPLASWLLDRIEADEAAARAVPATETYRVESSAAGASPWLLADHYRRHDPARVLAQCAAYRRIVELHHEGPAGSCETCSGEYLPCSTLRALASIYADAPGFREEWR
jgi:hypothetical protein